MDITIDPYTSPYLTACLYLAREGEGVAYGGQVKVKEDRPAAWLMRLRMFLWAWVMGGSWLQ